VSIRAAPIARGGNLFKREWFVTFHPVPGRFDRVVQSWDCAFKTGQSNDYSACVTIGEIEDRSRDGSILGLYLLHAWHRRVGFADLKRRAVEFARDWRVDTPGTGASTQC
jgi:phage terminase large subunit-like protein